MLSAINFADPQLEKCYERSLGEASDRFGELRQVAALIRAHDVCRLIDGPGSPKVRELVQHLLSPELRPMLRKWYARSRDDLTGPEMALRNHLSHLTGENL